MKKLLLFALVILAVAVNAQSRHPYDCDFKYGFFSNWNIYAAAQYSNQRGQSNIGINALATKRISDYWRLRYSATISGLAQKEGFDRYGTALSGIALDFVPWAYAFADAGVSVNPSTKGWLGLAADAGLGLNVNVGDYSLLYAEAGADRTQANTQWNSTLFFRLGWGAKLGPTKRDRTEYDIKMHNAAQLGELKEENRLLKTDLKRQQEANDTLMAIQNRSLELLARLEKRLDDCNQQVATASSAPSASSPIFQIFFDYASSEITPIEAAKVAQLAEHIKSNGGYWRLQGYSSPDGNVYRNEALSQERAYAVYWLLLSHDVDEDQIIPMGEGVTTQYGDDSPLNRMVVVSKAIQ